MFNVFSGHELKAPMRNVFQIDHPETYTCRMWRYNPGKGELAFFVTRDTMSQITHRDFYLVFDDVRYFAGPTFWKGADFCTASLKDYSRLMLRLKSKDKLSTTELNEAPPLASKVAGRLFLLDTPNVQVRIVSNQVTMTDNLFKMDART